MISRRYGFVFKTLGPVLRLYNRLAYNFSVEPAPQLDQETPALIMSNHVSNFDPIFLATAFRRPIFFVASDHIFRLGLISRLIVYLVAPIPIVKSRIDIRTIRTILRITRDNGLIGLFPEGNRSFNGVTGRIPPSTGKLVKQLKSPLILYRITGGALTIPRWARYRRKGRMLGKLSRVIDPQTLAAMTPEEINQAIHDAIFDDPYAEQLNHPVHFKGKCLAEHLERSIFVCPKCFGISTLTSCDDRFSCSCGLSVRYNTLGFFEPADSWSRDAHQNEQFLETPAAWDSWQRETLAQWLDEEAGPLDLSGSEPVFADEHETLFDCQRANRNIQIDHGTLSMTVDKIEFTGELQGTQTFLLRDIDRMIVHGPQVLQFATRAGQVYECKSPKARSAYKYVTLFNLLLQREKGEAYGFHGL